MEIVNWKRGLDEMLSCKLKHNSAVHIGSNLGLKTVRSATFNDFFKFPKTSGEKK